MFRVFPDSIRSVVGLNERTSKTNHFTHTLALLTHYPTVILPRILLREVLFLICLSTAWSTGHHEVLSILLKTLHKIKFSSFCKISINRPYRKKGQFKSINLNGNTLGFYPLTWELEWHNFLIGANGGLCLWAMQLGDKRGMNFSWTSLLHIHT